MKEGDSFTVYKAMTKVGEISKEIQHLVVNLSEEDNFFKISQKGEKTEEILIELIFSKELLPMSVICSHNLQDKSSSIKTGSVGRYYNDPLFSLKMEKYSRYLGEVRILKNNTIGTFINSPIVLSFKSSAKLILTPEDKFNEWLIAPLEADKKEKPLPEPVEKEKPPLEKEAAKEEKPAEITVKTEKKIKEEPPEDLSKGMLSWFMPQYIDHLLTVKVKELFEKEKTNYFDKLAGELRQNNYKTQNKIIVQLKKELKKELKAKNLTENKDAGYVKIKLKDLEELNSKIAEIKEINENKDFENYVKIKLSQLETEINSKTVEKETKDWENDISGLQKQINSLKEKVALFKFEPSEEYSQIFAELSEASRSFLEKSIERIEAKLIPTRERQRQRVYLYKSINDFVKSDVLTEDSGIKGAFKKSLKVLDDKFNLSREVKPFKVESFHDYIKDKISNGSFALPELINGYLDRISNNVTTLLKEDFAEEFDTATTQQKAILARQEFDNWIKNDFYPVFNDMWSLLRQKDTTQGAYKIIKDCYDNVVEALKYNNLEIIEPAVGANYIEKLHKNISEADTTHLQAIVGKETKVIRTIKKVETIGISYKNGEVLIKPQVGVETRFW